LSQRSKRQSLKRTKALKKPIVIVVDDREPAERAGSVSPPVASTTRYGRKIKLPAKYK
jgi:hypothetical protein